MGFSSSKSKTTPTAYAKPYITAAGDAQAPAFQAQQAQVAATQPGLESGTGYFGDVLSGKFRQAGNPFTEQLVSDSNADVTDAVNGSFMSRFGSGYHAKTLAREIGANSARIRGGIDDRERAYQDQAPRGLLDLAMGRVALPGIPAQQYAQNLGNLFGQYNKTTTSTPWGPALINGASNAAGAYFGGKASDRRLKMDIRQIGQEADGLGVYEYRYVTDDHDAPLRTGVMADEVATIRPWALGPDRNGFATVNYGVL